MPERRKHLRFRKKSGTPPGIRTRNFMFLRHARMPVPPAGQTKSPGTLRCDPGFEREQRNVSASGLLRSRWHARGHGRTRAIARPARCGSALGLSVVAMSCNTFQSSSFRCCWSCANAAASAALTSKNKKPGALSRSGLVTICQLSLAISPARTRGPHRISGDTTPGARCIEAVPRPALRSM